MKAKNIEQYTILQRNPSQLFSVIDEEVVMLSIENGEYYCLNEVGSSIWNFLENPCSYSKLLSKLIGDYNANAELIDIDTKPYLLELASKGIILIKND